MGRLLSALNPAQAQAVTVDSHRLCILAGAGSGKTRVLTHRIAYRLATGSALPQHVLALTFTRRAAAELASRLASLGIRDRVAAGTFHSVAYAQLRRIWAERGERPPALLERKTRLLAPLLPRRPPPGGPHEAAPARTVQPADVAAEIEWAKARMVPPCHYEQEVARAGRKTPLPPGAVAVLYERYEADKRRKGLVDFDDLLVLCAVALETDAGFAAAQRWRFRHLFVDEFQDVNPVQFRLLDGWRGDTADLCVVGDPNQAIYSWNGADPRYLTEFATRFPGAVTVRLDDNYRSSPQIVGVANVVLESGVATATGSPGKGGRLRANRPDGPIPTVRSYASDTDEARAVAKALRRRRGASRAWSGCAVLTRTHAQLVLFEEALRTAGIPYRMKGTVAFLDQPEIKQAFTDLARWSSRPLSETLPDLREAAHTPGEAAAGGAVDGGDDPESERRRNLGTLLRLADEHLASDPLGTVGAFLGWLRATLASEQPEPGGNAVELATFHAAKGLEWPVVFVAGLEQGLMPIGHAETPAAKAEERRLLYVALTRAQDELHCSWAEKRTFGTRVMGRSPSPYLAAISAAVESMANGAAPGDWRRFLDDNRSRLRQGERGRNPRSPSRPRCGENADPTVLQALKTWRASTARASGVPAFVVFHDTTLAAVAEVKPRSRSALLSLPGMGPVKAERYGDAVLQVVARATSGDERRTG